MKEATKAIKDLLKSKRMAERKKKALCEKIVNAPKCNLETFELCLKYLQRLR